MESTSNNKDESTNNYDTNEQTALVENRTGLSYTSFRDKYDRSTTNESDSFDNNNNNRHSSCSYRQLHSTFVYVVVATMAVAIVSYTSNYYYVNNNNTTSISEEVEREKDTKLFRKREQVVEQLGASLPSQDLSPIDDDDDDDDDLIVPFLQATHGLQLVGYPSPAEQVQYEKDLQKINWTDVAKDIAVLLKGSMDWWPADYGSYGPLMIRLSWHSCGSYRTSDGRGGCDGGSQRFDPERSWPDNTNLDKARRLLEPIKIKYGNGVSWGDLFALVGTVAIREMGGPDIGFCAGRQDVQDNSQTIQLGPSLEQQQFGQCPINGQCPFPLGTNTIGLIYVNPEGPMGEPDVIGAAETIRDVFGRMDWHGRDLVALIGGGHTFGKAHGASTRSNGVPPNECPFASWDGPIGTEAITSGFEGPWTSDPTRWDNHYFKYLVDYEWEPLKGPGGHFQWRIITNNDNSSNAPKAPTADPSEHGKKQNIMMLTTDVALKFDDEYRQYVYEFAANETLFKETFAKAWYKLVTRDIGPVSRCAGMQTEARSFQHPLPDTPKKLANMDLVKSDLKKLMTSFSSDEQFIRLAYQCASTYRATDYSGGCNGARIRFPPGSEWPINAGLNDTIALLTPIKVKYGDGLSYADLIVLAGNVAAERAGSSKLKFCPGRTDDDNGKAWDRVSYGNTDQPATVEKMIELLHRRGQTYKDFVALTFVRFRTTKNLREALNYPNHIHNGTTTDIDLTIRALQSYPEIRYWAEKFATSTTNEYYANAFAESWTRLMNADRFDGPIRNLCG